MIRLTLAMAAFSIGVVYGLACGSGDSSTTRRVNTPAPSTMTMEPTPMTPSAMSVRSGPAKVPEEDVVQWRAALAESSGGGAGRMTPLTPLNKTYDEVLERGEDITRRMTQDQAQRLVKQMLQVGMNADPEDPCERVMAMYDSLSGELQLDPALREDAERRCRETPSSHLACLKPERERTPFERRTCRRFLRDTDTPDVMGENGAIMQELPPGVQQGPQRVDGPASE